MLSAISWFAGVELGSTRLWASQSDLRCHHHNPMLMTLCSIVHAVIGVLHPLREGLELAQVLCACAAAFATLTI
jgi:hypothetical protein